MAMSPWASSDWASWARGRRRTWRKAGYELTRLQPHAREGRGVGRRARRHASRTRPREVAERSRRRDHDGRRRRRRSRRCCSARTARWRAPRDGTLFVDMSTIAPGTARALGERCAERGHAFVDAPGHGLLAQGRGRDADDHVPAAPTRTSSAPGRCSRSMGEKIVHAGEARPGPGGQGASRNARHGGQLRDARPGARGRPAGGRRPRRARWSVDGRRLGATRRCAR